MTDRHTTNTTPAVAPGLYLLCGLDTNANCVTAAAVLVIAGPGVHGTSRTIWIGNNRSDALANPAPLEGAGDLIGVLDTDDRLLGLTQVPINGAVTDQTIDALVAALHRSRPTSVDQ